MGYSLKDISHLRSISNIKEYLYGLFIQVPDVEQQKASWIIIFVFLLIVFKIFHIIYYPFVRDKKWLHERCAREWNQYEKMFREFGMKITKEEFIEQRKTSYPDWLLMIIQHFIGFALCLPAIFAWSDDLRFVQALACLASTLEMSYEWQDYLKRLWTHFTDEFGAVKEPTALLIIFGLHHTLSLLSVPMNIYYYHEYYYWNMLAVQQFAAAFAYMVAEYTFVLDVTTKGGMMRMRYANLIAFIVLLWTRGFHYFWISYNVFLVLYHDKAWTFFYTWSVIFLVFTGFNVSVVILPFYQRTVKWFKKQLPKEDESKKGK